MNLLAVATEEPDARPSSDGTLRLWATMPDRNLVNSRLAVNPTSAAASGSSSDFFVLTRPYRWNSLGSGLCPNDPFQSITGLLFPDTDLTADIRVTPVGSTFAFSADDLYHEWKAFFQDAGASAAPIRLSGSQPSAGGARQHHHLHGGSRQPGRRHGDWRQGVRHLLLRPAPARRHPRRSRLPRVPDRGRGRHRTGRYGHRHHHRHYRGGRPTGATTAASTSPGCRKTYAARCWHGPRWRASSSTAARRSRSPTSSSRKPRR